MRRLVAVEREGPPTPPPGRSHPVHVLVERSLYEPLTYVHASSILSFEVEAGLELIRLVLEKAQRSSIPSVELVLVGQDVITIRLRVALREGGAIVPLGEKLRAERGDVSSVNLATCTYACTRQWTCRV